MIRRIGPHAVTNASVENPIVDQLIQGETVQIVYSDPPWGDGNAKYWATMNKKMTGAEYKPLSYKDIIQRIMGIVKRQVDGHVFIETGLQWEKETVEFMSFLHNVKSFKLKYRSGSKILENVLIFGGTSRHHDLSIDPTGGIGLPLVQKIISSVAKPGSIVLDPCCGMGYTAKASVPEGMIFRGNEFNAKRLQKTIDFLEKSV